MLEIKGLSVTYNNEGKKIVSALEDISLNIKRGEFISLVASSGAGKTTLLKIIAGLLQPTHGEIFFHGEKITGPSKDRGLVFQQFSLFPWLTARENVAFGLKLSGNFQKNWKQKTDAILDDFGLLEFADSYPKSLSGGMQQRVAIARTIVTDPEIILMDEPFGSLDSQTRSKMQEFLVSVYEKTKKTIIFVTHDIAEAVFLSNKVYVLTSRPAKVKSVYEIPFSRPRLHVLKHADDFAKLVVKVTSDLD